MAVFPWSFYFVRRRWARSGARAGSWIVLALVTSLCTTELARAAEADGSVGADPPRSGQPRFATSPWVRQKPKPPPLHVGYASYGVAVSLDVLAHAGASCREGGAPCILGSGGGLVLRGGYRSPGPWYVGGAYQFSKTNSSNLYRLGILQQLRAEMRYMLDMGYRAAPYATWGVGGVVYGNEWMVETGGGSLFAGLGIEWQLARLAVLGLSVQYQPVLFAGWTDTANFERDPGLAQFVHVELQLEMRSELSRR